MIGAASLYRTCIIPLMVIRPEGTSIIGNKRNGGRKIRACRLIMLVEGEEGAAGAERNMEVVVEEVLEVVGRGCMLA